MQRGSCEGKHRSVNTFFTMNNMLSSYFNLCKHVYYYVGILLTRNMYQRKLLFYVTQHLFPLHTYKISFNKAMLS